jgi:pilus assembly protein TadC
MAQVFDNLQQNIYTRYSLSIAIYVLGFAGLVLSLLINSFIKSNGFKISFVIFSFAAELGIYLALIVFYAWTMKDYQNIDI